MACVWLLTAVVYLLTGCWRATLIKFLQDELEFASSSLSVGKL